jgi:hypothetical protein
MISAVEVILGGEEAVRAAGEVTGGYLEGAGE